MTLHKMTPVDAAWFHMDGPANLAVVTGVSITKAPLDFGKVKALYQARLQHFPRFRQRVVEHGLPIPSPHWEDMPNFDIGQHLHHVALPEPRDRKALARMLGDIVSMPLDRLQPLWQVHVIDGVEGGSALVTRFHHCIGDGTAMTALSVRHGRNLDLTAGLRYKSERERLARFNDDRRDSQAVYVGTAFRF